MAIFTDNITIYNYHKDIDGKDAWNKTYLYGVQWSDKSDKSISNDGRIQIIETATLTIPIDLLSQYKNYIDYSNLSFNDSKKYWTLNYINNLDVICLGIIDKDISSTYKITDLKKDFSEIGTVSSVNDNSRRDFLKNIKVILK